MPLQLQIRVTFDAGPIIIAAAAAGNQLAGGLDCLILIYTPSSLPIDCLYTIEYEAIPEYPGPHSIDTSTSNNCGSNY
jgi:hypothetical protein